MTGGTNSLVFQTRTAMSQNAADRLKAEGNALFAKKKFKEAYTKYTEALKHDDKNPILYSNRSACSLGLHRYADVSTSVEVDELNEAYMKVSGCDHGRHEGEHIHIHYAYINQFPQAYLSGRQRTSTPGTQEDGDALRLQEW